MVKIFVINDYIKSTSKIPMPIYVKMFNIVLNFGNVTESWLVSNILPIYKNKGDLCDPKNYIPIGITILSCMGKLFTAVLNSRLSSFVEHFCTLK